MAKDWTHLFEHYRGKWVVLAEDETTVLAAGETAREACAAFSTDARPPLLYRVPLTLDAFAGYVL